MVSESKGVGIFTTMGSGKTLMAIGLTNLLDVKKGLIVAPLSVLPVWPNEFAIHSDKQYKVMPLDKKEGYATRLTVEQKAEYVDEILANDEDTILVVNYESAWRKPLAKKLIDAKFDIVILDESHRIKTTSSKVSKFFHKLGPSAKYRIALTGTPIAGNSAEIFSQYKFLNPNIFGKSEGAFKKRFFLSDYWGNVTQEINPEFLRQQIDSISYTAGTEILKDMPDKLFITLPCELSGKALKAYNEIINGMWVEIENAQSNEEEGMIANIALTQMLRASQVSSGIVGGVKPKGKSNAEARVERITGSPKKDMLHDILDGIDKKQDKVVVFARFTPEIQDIKEVAEKLGYRTGEVSGNSKDGLNDKSQMSEDCDLVVCQYQAGSVGVNLTAANHTIFYSLDYSLSNWEQAIARTHRPGQTKPCKFYTFLCEGVEEQIYDSLQQKQSVTDWFKAETRRRRLESLSQIA